MKHLFLFSTIILFAFISCSKQYSDAHDAALIEGRWKVESIRYVGTLNDGTEVSNEENDCDFFWVGDIVEFKGGELFLGEKGSGLYSLFSGYPGSIQYSIVNHQLFIPEQVFEDYPQDTGNGWTATMTITVGEWTLPYSLSEDTWIIWRKHRIWSAVGYGQFYCDFEFILKRVE
ncbi:MAG: hypothetical protein IJP49_01945 [Bacteroidales bacterium]|nr:hypothetical protein [Bacteroidales bacterium]